jgi:hypothetical protein
MQMRANVSDATITEADLLWNSGGDSLWRVTVERTVTAPGISSTEEVSWDFQITQAGSSYALISFAEVLGSSGRHVVTTARRWTWSPSASTR